MLPYELTASAVISAGAESEQVIWTSPLPDLAVSSAVEICWQVIRPYEVDTSTVSADAFVTLILPLAECRSIDLPLSSSAVMEP